MKNVRLMTKIMTYIKTENKTKIATIGFGVIAVILTASLIAYNPMLQEAQGVKSNDSGVESRIGAMATVPIGTVLDWFCESPCNTIPAGYALADGSTVDDPGSPLNGVTLPDLRQKFVRGAETTGDVGNTGGVTSHEHSVNPPNTVTTVDGVHEHSVNPPNTVTTLDGTHAHSVDPPNTYTNSEGQHSHADLTGTTGSTVSDTEKVMDCKKLGTFNLNCKTVADNSHSHSISLEIQSSGLHTHRVNIDRFDSASAGDHTHNVDMAAFDSASAGDHTHNVDMAAFDSAPVDNLPPFVDLVKIIRIK